MINYEIKFITYDDAVTIKSTDLKASKYFSRKKNEESVLDSAKKSYLESRGNKKRSPRSRSVRELENKLRDRFVVFCEWTSTNLVTIVFSSGTVAFITVNEASLDVVNILFDGYCNGKLSGQVVCGAVYSLSHLLFVHPEGTATLISFGSTNANDTSSLPCKIADRNPQVQSIELADGARRAERKVSWNELSNDQGGTATRVLIWTAAGADPAPWSPAPEIRANLHLYQINGSHMNVIAYHQLENEVLSAELSQKRHSTIHIVDQITCQKSGVNLNWVRYEVDDAEEGVIRLSSHRAGGTRVSLPAVARAVKRSACDTRLLIACIDGTLHIAHHVAGLTHSTRCGFIASTVHWSGDAVICGEESARLQCYDRTLTLLHHNTKCIHLQQYTSDNPHMSVLATRNIESGAVLVTLFAGGPLALLRLTHSNIPLGWIRAGLLPRAVAVLQAMDWDTEGDQCLHTLQRIAAEVFRRGLDASSESALEQAMGCYLASRTPRRCSHHYREPVTRIARRFHHHLLRRGRLDKALSLAVDLGCWDLFADARWSALKAGNHSIADEAQVLAEEYASRERPESECSGSCSCSTSTYSDTDDSSSRDVETKPPPLPRIPNQPTIMPVPIQKPEQISTNSIRPNLHQYLERDNTIWNTEVKQDKTKPALRSRSMDVLTENSKRVLNTIEEQPRLKSSIVDLPRYESQALYQRELREDAPLYRFQNYKPRDFEKRSQVEKNVKFSDTVTIAVVPERCPEPGFPEPARELADSLPLCAPHAYLAAFDPAPGTTFDYVEV